MLVPDFMLLKTILNNRPPEEVLSLDTIPRKKGYPLYYSNYSYFSDPQTDTLLVIYSKA